MEITYLGKHARGDRPASWSGILVTTTSDVLLLDCGHTIREDLQAARTELQDVQCVLLSELGVRQAGFGPFAIAAWRGGRREPLTIFGPPGVEQMTDATRQLYSPEIHAGLSQDRLDSAGIRWDVHEIDGGDVLTTPGIHVSVTSTDPNDALCHVDYTFTNGSDSITLPGYQSLRRDK